MSASTSGSQQSEPVPKMVEHVAAGLESL